MGLLQLPETHLLVYVQRIKGWLAFLNISKTLGCIIGPLLVSCYAYYIGCLQDNITTLFIFLPVV